MRNSFEDVKKFSKDHSQEERDRLARDAFTARKEHFDDVRSAGEEKSDFFQDVLEHDAAASHLIHDVSELSSEQKLILRRFSKEHSPETRAETVRVIREERAAYFEGRKDLENQLLRFQSEVTETRENVQSLESRILDTEVKIEKLRDGLFNKILLWAGVRPQSITDIEQEHEGLRFEKIRREDGVKVLEEEIRGLQGLLRERGASRITRERLAAFYKSEAEKWARDIDDRLDPNRKSVLDEETRASISNFYENEREKFEEYERDREVRSVRNVMNSNDVLFVHGIKTDFVPGDNSLLRSGVGWEIKLKILLAFEPVLSASTIRRGDTSRKMWSGIGVLLRDGRVEQAFVSDAGTKAKGISRRERLGKSNQDNKDIADEILSSVHSTHDSYNEFVVSAPQIAGLYVEEEWFQNNRGMFADVSRVIEEADIPFYVVRNGEAFKGEIIDGALVVRDKQNIREILGGSFEVSDEMREKLITEVFDANPFNIKNPELYVLDTEQAGAQFYEILSFFQKKDDVWSESPKEQFRESGAGTDLFQEGASICSRAACFRHRA